MTIYINAGASLFDPGTGGQRNVKTKAELKREVDAVWFYSTSAFTPWNGLAKDLPPGTTLTVVGPNPYTKRSWYASVTFDATKGKATVK